MPWPGGEVIRWSPTFLECFNPQPLHSPVGGSAVTGQVTAPLLQASSYRQVHGGAPRAQPSPRHNQHGERKATPSQQGVEGPADQMWRTSAGHTPRPPRPRHPPADSPTVLSLLPEPTGNSLCLVCSWGTAGTKRSLGLWFASSLVSSYVSPD